MNMFSIGKLLLTFRLSSVPLGGLNLIPHGIFIHQNKFEKQQEMVQYISTLEQAMTLFN